MKKFLLIGILLSLFSMTGLFALGEVESEFIDVVTRQQFLDEVATDDLIMEVFKEAETGDPTLLFEIVDENLTDEVIDLMKYLSKTYIPKNYKVKDNGAYMFFVTREEDSLDGWFVFYHYSKKAKDKECFIVYYFSFDELEY